MYRILITDASYKHSIAMQRHIRKAQHDVELVGHDSGRLAVCKYYGYLDSIIKKTPLNEVLAASGYDMVIPVGASSVATVSDLCPKLAVLPSRDSVSICLDKNATMALADRVGVPRPESQLVKDLGDLESCSIPLPCVVKPGCETEAKGVTYAKTSEQLRQQVAHWLEQMPASSGCGVLVQEYIKGSGAGFFALLDNGNPLRIFMHQRLREYPVTGGASTAARAFYHSKLKDYGLRLLQELKWNGVAMVEFKYDEEADRLVLIEINPKFWGSLELALEAGVNFGSDLVRLYRGESLEYSEDYNRNLHFYWPLDGDILNLIHTHSLWKARDYRGANAATNLGYSKVADCVGLAKTLVKLVSGK